MELSWLKFRKKTIKCAEGRLFLSHRGSHSHGGSQREGRVFQNFNGFFERL